jgi:formylglycine-generating enzyme required for sulfatase activity
VTDLDNLSDKDLDGVPVKRTKPLLEEFQPLIPPLETNVEASIMQINDIEKQLQSLAKRAQTTPPRSRDHRRALTEICQILDQPGVLKSRPGIHPQILNESKQDILVYVCTNINKYNPGKGGFLPWINSHFKWLQRDAEVKFNRSQSLYSFQWSENELQQSHSRQDESNKISRNRQLVSTLRNISRTSQGFIEPLLIVPSGLPLHMVQVPSGTFLMGSPGDDEEHSRFESPQHEVTVTIFFMSRYPVTQAQWRAVAQLPKVSRELAIEPSAFKGDNLPVEQVSWYDAKEFCDRLSQLTTRAYRLPSEAEWEYACRAGTSSSFYFGQKVTPEVANYKVGVDEEGFTSSQDWNMTTSVNHFGIGNAFGLSDMHGNVWEWCEDTWHENYIGAPTDGSAWILPHGSNRRVARGGSWFFGSSCCRSAHRGQNVPHHTFKDHGFRVACTAPKALG